MVGKNAGVSSIVFSYTSGKILLDNFMCIFSWIGQQILIIWDFISVVWKWFEDNSGQIQIIIAVPALIYAWKAYHKVLHQIDISNQQTTISIAQMDKLNNERLFELKLRLKIRIGEQSRDLRELQDASNNLSSRLQVLSIDTKENHPKSFDAIEGMIKVWRESITSAWDLVGTKIKENNGYLEKIATTTDIVFMEEILDKIEQNQFIYQAKIHEIRNLDEHVTKVWKPMNVGVMEAMKSIHNFN